MRTSTQTALLDPDVLSRIEVPEETPAETETRQDMLAARLATYIKGSKRPLKTTAPVVQTLELDLEVPTRLAALLAARQPDADAETLGKTAWAMAAALDVAAEDRHGIQVGLAQAAEALLAADDCACGHDHEAADAEPCDACALAADLGTVIIVNGDEAPETSQPAPTPEPAAAVDGEPTLADEGTAAEGAASPDRVVIDPENPGRFRSVLLVEGERTADDRVIDPGATIWRPTPLTFSLMVETQPGHMGARACGVIEDIFRDGNEIIGTGRFHTHEDGLNAADLVANQVVTGVSVDPGDVTVEYEIEEFDEDGYPVRVLEHYTTLTILQATICPAQAIGSAHVEYEAPASLAASAASPVRPFVSDAAVVWSPDESDAPPLSEADVDAVIEAAVALTAGIGVVFDARHFENPAFTGPTPLRVKHDGSFHGHLAIWGECHVGIPGACMMAPHSQTDYAYFKTGYVLSDQGEIPVGTLTLATVHADQALGLSATLAHYDNTGLAAAYANVGEDQYGIWVAGVIKPGLSDDRVTEFTASKMSGDWRDVRGHLELAACLGVNSPGFPIARVVDGRPTSLVAAIGPVLPTETLATAELRATKAEQAHLAQRIEDLEARLKSQEDRFGQVWRDHLARRLAPSA